MASPVRSVLCFVVTAAFAGAIGCGRQTPPPDSSVASASATPSASAAPAEPATANANANAKLSPLARLVPKPQSGPRSTASIAITPGVSFGPIALGETLEDLKRGGLTVSGVTESHADVTAGALAMKVSLCQGKIIDIWIDDLRLAPPILTYDGKPIASKIKREDLEKALGGCSATPPRTGGAFETCQDGGVYVGHGMGDFLQIRVRPKSFPFDDTCSFATDDGSSAELSSKERSFLFKKALIIDGISKYWHVDRPGRDPLRIVRTPLVPEESLTMFGSPVKWIDEREATKGTAFLSVTKLEATKTTATLVFAYPIEGVVGTAVFKRSSPTDEWRLETSNVAER